MKESEAVMNVSPSPSFATQESEARLLRVDEVSAIVGLKRTTIWHRCNPDSPYYDASFPKPIRIGSRRIAWNRPRYSSMDCCYYRTRPFRLIH